MSGPVQQTVLAPDDGSTGPLLRLSDDRLGPGEGYGRHEHTAVDVVAVVLTGSLRHRWRDGAALGAGDVGVLRAGTGLAHDESAGDEGARVLQCYLRPADPGAPPRHDVHPAAAGWIDLGRPDARLWVGNVPAGVATEVPAGLLVTAGRSTSTTEHDGGTLVPSEPVTLLVWQVDTARPAWAES